MKAKIFTYLRVSTSDQADKNTQEGQMNAIQRYLSTLDVDIIHKFEDLGKMGDDVTREQFNKMISRLSEVEGVAVFDLDRLSRDLIIGIDLMKVLMMNHVKIYEARTNTIKDLHNDTDQLMYLISMWSNATEKKKIHARQKEGIERYIEKKGRWGRGKSFGKDLSGKRMTKNQFQIQYTTMIQKGISKRAIARLLSMDIATLYKRIKEIEVIV
jgi:DNA invertase Pin-like site-specific DNA recombinase